MDALNGGQAGNFRKVNADGSPDLAGGLDPDAPALFSPMHAALGPIPGGVNACVPTLPTALVDGKTEAVVVDPADPIALTNFNDYSSGGCPNKWAAREGFEGQILGYQTQNQLTGPDDLSSALWNATLNSNAVFVEVYEKVLWIAEQHRLAGNAVLSTTSAGFADVPERQKSLAAVDERAAQAPPDHRRFRGPREQPAHEGSISGSLRVHVQEEPRARGPRVAFLHQSRRALHCGDVVRTGAST